MRVAVFLLLACAARAQFRAQEIASSLGVVYALQIADVNHDGRRDILAITPTQVIWFENPSWQKRVILDGGTKKDNVCISPHDIDGDGKLDFAVGADWQATNTQSGGSLQWVSHDGRVTAIGEEPTLHRMRWGDVDGDRKPELVVVPLHGRNTKGPEWQGQGARILVFRPPQDPAKQPWTSEVADDSLHIVHNFIIVNGEIWTASAEGVHALKRGKDGKWTRRQIGEGKPGEIKLGRTGGARHIATVEPWHGNSIVVYREAKNGLWPRDVIETQLTQAHALSWADFDGDKHDELAVGWRNKPFGVAFYQRGKDGKWSKHMVDEGGMAAEDIDAGDLNGDGKPEIVAGGRATQNIKIYWNER